MAHTKKLWMEGRDASEIEMTGRDRNGDRLPLLLVPKAETPAAQGPERVLAGGGVAEQGLGRSGGQAGEQGGELQGLPRQLGHTLCHLLGCRTRWVAQSGPLDSEHSRLQRLAQRCARSPNLCPQRSGGGQPAQRVPNKHKAVSGHHHLLAVGHEEARGLVGPAAGHQGCHGCLQC